MAVIGIKALPGMASRGTVRSRSSTIAGVLPKKLHSELNAGVPPPPNKGMRDRSQLVYDEAKEISRTYRRVVFDFDYWANHRSTSRYFFHMVTLPNSRIIRSLGFPIAWVMGIATIIGANHTLVAQGIIPKALELGTIDMAPVSLTSFALSLLLVFRTNSSYGRFDEARKMWGLMLNRSRDIVRQATSFFPEKDVMGNENQHMKATFARWTVVFTIALKCHLRPNEDLAGEASKLLSEEELDLLLTAEHKVLLCLQVMSHIIERSGISDMQRLQMQENITTFEDILGGCERLLRTPIPVSYTRHTSRFLLLWLTILPYALWAKLAWAAVPAVGLIALLLLGIEEIGVEIEEPFGILPLEVISNKAKADIIEIMNRQDTVKDIACTEESPAQTKVNGTVFDLPQSREPAKMW